MQQRLKSNNDSKITDRYGISAQDPHLSDTYSSSLTICNFSTGFECSYRLLMRKEFTISSSLTCIEVHMLGFQNMYIILIPSKKATDLHGGGFVVTPKQSKGSYQTLKRNRKQITNGGNLFDQGPSATICLKEPPSRIEKWIKLETRICL